VQAQTTKNDSVDSLKQFNQTMYKTPCAGRVGHDNDHEIPVAGCASTAVSQSVYRHNTKQLRVNASPGASASKFWLRFCGDELEE
jgi:hypothetical protein